MPKSKFLSQTITIAAVFIILEIAAIAMLKSSSDIQNVWLNRASHRVMGALWGTGESISDYFSLKEINAKLSEENGDLLRELIHCRALLANVDEIEASVRDISDMDFQCIPASIVKMSCNLQGNYIILDKGSEDGVSPNSGIITSHGVVGMITAVDKHFSYGMSLMNKKISISSRIGKDGGLAPLTWDGVSSDKAVLKDVPLQYKIEAGDTVWTSGFSEIYPKDIPLGVVDSKRIVNGAVNYVTINLFLDFSSVRYVTVTVNPSKEEIEKMENQ